jgi:chemotaxis signal transduction protein
MPVLVRFSCAGTRYAVDVSASAGVVAWTGAAPLPDPRPDVVGVIRESGAVLPVLAPFGTDGGHVLVLQPPGGLRFGLLVGEVEGVIRIPAGDVEPAPAGQRTDVVRGVVGDVLLLDPARLAGALGA